MCILYIVNMYLVYSEARIIAPTVSVYPSHPPSIELSATQSISPSPILGLESQTLNFEYWGIISGIGMAIVYLALLTDIYPAKKDTTMILPIDSEFSRVIPNRAYSQRL